MAGPPCASLCASPCASQYVHTSDPSQEGELDELELFKALEEAVDAEATPKSKMSNNRTSKAHHAVGPPKKALGISNANNASRVSLSASDTGAKRGINASLVQSGNDADSFMDSVDMEILDEVDGWLNSS